MLSALISAPILVQSLSIQPPVSSYKHLEGGCRTADITKGTYHTLQGISRWECEDECSFDTKCLAYEYNDHKQCEIHYEAITQTGGFGFFGVTCDIKLPSEDRLVCAADVFKCPGVDFFVSRDPHNKCEFKVEDCPEDPWGEGPFLTRSADAAFQLRANQRDYDRVMAVPVHERKAELERIRAEIDAEGPFLTRSADAAFQLRTWQEDYDRVMAVSVLDRKATFEQLREAITFANGSEGLTGKRSADEAFRLRHSQEDYDRVMAVPVHKRKAELERIRAEI